METTDRAMAWTTLLYYIYVQYTTIHSKVCTIIQGSQPTPAAGASRNNRIFFQVGKVLIGKEKGSPSKPCARALRS